MSIPIPVTRYRLGAEELIELGRGRKGIPAVREPFLAGRPRGARRMVPNALGEMADRTGPFVTEALGRALGFLSGMMEVGILESPVDRSAGAAADLFAHVPGTEEVAAQALLLGSAAMRFGLPFPEGEDALGRALAALRMALASRRSQEERMALVEGAKVDVVRGADQDRKADLMRTLDTVTADPPAVGAAGGPVVDRTAA